MKDVEIIEPGWTLPGNVHAAFTLRVGGISGPPYDSLNLGTHVGDAPDAVAENRRRVRDQLQLPAEPAWLQQIHGNRVADLDTELEPGAADAVVARQGNRVCVIQVADCIPVLFAARDGAVVAAAHAGWRGLAGGVLDATVRQMGVAPGDILAWLGPGISQRHFEVGDDVRAAFGGDDEQAQGAFEANSRGRWQCDLYALARRKLLGLGIKDVSGGGLCTYAHASKFFSYRRDGRCGRMAALIWLG